VVGFAWNVVCCCHVSVVACNASTAWLPLGPVARLEASDALNVIGGHKAHQCKVAV